MHKKNTILYSGCNYVYGTDSVTVCGSYGQTTGLYQLHIHAGGNLIAPQKVMIMR